jgi:hypothetical protein
MYIPAESREIKFSKAEIDAELAAIGVAIAN